MKFFQLVCFLCLLCSLQAQDLIYNIQFFDQEDGLPIRDVKRIIQDDRGMIWVGTRNGFCRFDGVSFSRVKGEGNPVANGLIRDVYKDKDGTFWVQRLKGGVVHLDPVSEQIIPLQKDLSDVGEITMTGNSYYFHSYLIFVDQHEQSYYLSEHGTLKPFLPKGLIPLYELGDGEYIVQHQKSSEFLIKVNHKGERLDEIEYSIYGPYMFPVLFKQKKGNAHIAAKREFIKDKYLSEIFEYEDERNQVSPLELTINGKPFHISEFKYGENVNTIYLKITRDSKKRFWLTANNRLYLFDANGNLIKDLSKDIQQLAPTGFTINHQFLDNQDRLWIGTGAGLFLVNAKENPFQNYLSSSGSESVRGIQEIGEGQLLVGSYRGTKILDIESGEILNHFSENLIGITDIANDSIWSGVHGRGKVLVFSLDTKKIGFKYFDFDETPAGDMLFYDSISNHIYMGMDSGLAYLDESRKRYEYSKLNEFQEFAHKKIQFFKATKNNIWIATSDGLYLLDREKGIVDHFKFDFNAISFIYTEDENIFWLATFGGGLIRWDKDKNRTRQYTTKDGFSDDIIYAIYKDAQGFFWLPSNNGLMRFNPTSAETVIFQPEDGISHKEFNTYSHYQADDGRLYFGGLNGVTAFYPEQVSPVENNAPFVITQFEQFDGASDSLLDKTTSLRASNKIILQPDDKFFTIHFALLDYADRKNIYAWKIEGLDEKWTHQTDNSIRINTLNYGNYTLRVKAKGAGGQWAKHTIDIPILVKKPIYLTTQFFLFSFVGVCLLTWLAIQYRTRQFRKRAEQLSIEVFERTQTIRDQNQALEKANHFKDNVLALVAHDLRSPILTMSGLTNKINFLIKKNRIDDISKLSDTIEHSTNKVNSLLDNIMNWALLQRGRFELQFEDLKVKNLIEESILFFKQMTEAKEIQINYSCRDDLNIYSDKAAMMIILRNIIHNAIKFSLKKGKVNISALNMDDQLVLKIQDWGIGMNEEHLLQLFKISKRTKTKGTNGEVGSGIGLAFCYDLVKLLNGNLEVVSKPAKGTTFIVKLPIKNNTSAIAP